MNDTLPTLTRRRARALFGDDTGAATAEYAITTMATVVDLRHTLRGCPHANDPQQHHPARRDLRATVG